LSWKGPNRTLASIVATADAPELQARLPANPGPLPPVALPWVGEMAPVRVRKFFFFDQRIDSDFFASDPTNPKGARDFFITVDGKDGKTPARFDPRSDVPEIVVKQGDVEDWIIENRSMELHDFHIHQIHFQLREWSGLAVNEPFLRDTVNVPAYNGRTLGYPSVRLRMDFRDPNIVGTFVYHCQLLDHEDGGVMGRIRVEPADAARSTKASSHP
jgi:FtsP/CotA-like multicopper oxidase with cupredoxin domain